MKTIVGLFDRTEDAIQTEQDLRKAGFAPQSVTVLRSMAAMWRYLGCRPAKVIARDFGIGAVLGIATYAFFGVLVAVGEITMGFDSVVATEALLVFVVLGLLVGGLLGVLFGMADSEGQSRTYVAGIRRGGAVIAVRTADEHSDRATDLLLQAGAREIHICHRNRSGWLRSEQRKEYA